MFNVVFLMVVIFALLVLLFQLGELGTGLGYFIFGTFVSRIGLHMFVREFKFFAHEKGGDAIQYEMTSHWIARYWSANPIRYMTDQDYFWIGKASLPQNVFGFIIYMNDGKPSSLSCTSLVALSLCIAALNFYFLAIELGAVRRSALNMTMAVFSMPSMIYYSTDMYKDAIVLMLVLGAVGSAIRLSRRFTVVHAIVGAVCLFALWFVRFYMVFLAVLPLIIGYVGFSLKQWYRPVLVLGIAAVLLVQFGETSDSQEMTKTADATFTHATGVAQDANRFGGSAVQLGRGIGSLPLRVIYTLFSPFPWMPGSVGFQLGKIDTLFLWYLMYRAAKSAKLLVRIDKATLLAIAAFTVPTTIAYAMTMSNIGLILRQRVPVVVTVALLAVLGFRREARARESRPSEPSRTRVGLRRDRRISAPAPDPEKMARLNG